MTRSRLDRRTMVALSVTAACALAVGCGGTEPPPPAPNDPFDPEVCRADVVQADLTTRDDTGTSLGGPAWIGPGVDPATGAIAVPAGAIVTTTYLQLRTTPEGQQAFGELVGPVIATLMTSPGLIAVSPADSESCAVARTLAIWESEDAMIDFVASDAHATAMRRVSEVSRGGSITTHWIAQTADDATWAAAAEHLRDHDGPVY